MSTSLQVVNAALAEFTQSYYNESGVRIEAIEIDWVERNNGDGDRVDHINVVTGCNIKEID